MQKKKRVPRKNKPRAPKLGASWAIRQGEAVVAIHVPGLGMKMIPALEAVKFAYKIIESAREGRCIERVLLDNPDFKP